MSKLEAENAPTLSLPQSPLIQAADALLDLLFPPRCITCEKLGGLDCLCTECIDKIESVDSPACPTCGLTMSANPSQPGLDTKSVNRPRRASTAHHIDHSIPASYTCPHCSERDHYFDKAASLGAYRGILRDAIHHLKYRDKPQLARPLGKLLADYARSQSSQFNNLQFDAALAIPMHPSRKKQRGYNQAERIAAVFCKETGIKLAKDIIQRKEKTKSQVGLSARERMTNIAGAFTVKVPEEVIGKTYLIIDDVTTTGSTLNECAKALKKAGAKRVYALTLAAD